MLPGAEETGGQGGYSPPLFQKCSYIFRIQPPNLRYTFSRISLAPHLKVRSAALGYHAPMSRRQTVATYKTSQPVLNMYKMQL